MKELHRHRVPGLLQGPTVTMIIFSSFVISMAGMQ